MPASKRGRDARATSAARGLAIPLVLVSGEGLGPAAREAITAAGLSLLYKPFRLNDLRQAIEAVLKPGTLPA